MDQWQVGDVVQLKSGGPIMTVDGFSGNEKCICVWFEKGEAQRAAYSPEALRKAPSGHGGDDKAV